MTRPHTATSASPARPHGKAARFVVESSKPLTINAPASAGYCAWDSDECWVMVAVDTPDELNVLIDQLKPRSRIRLMGDAL